MPLGVTALLRVANSDSWRGALLEIVFGVTRDVSSDNVVAVGELHDRHHVKNSIL